MHFFSEIIPIAEARIYLSGRFSGTRIRDRLESVSKYIPYMSNEHSSLLKSLVELEAELDAKFAPDDLMRSYFTPFMAREEIQYGSMFSIGGMLMSLPAEAKPPFGLDEIISVYKSWSSDDLMDFFMLKFCLADRSEIGRGAAGCMAIADKYLTNADDKWRFMEAVTDPFPHLEKLRPLIEGVADYIRQRSAEFEPLLKAALEDFNAFSSEDEILRKGLGIGLSKKDLEKAESYLSLMAFNSGAVIPSMHYYHKQDALPEAKVRIMFGAIAFFVLRFRSGQINADEYLVLLKLISDPTRFKVLHDLCDKSSFGLELAEKYNTSRGTMYYHLDKLRELGLIDLNSGEYRMLFTMNKQNVYDKLNAIRDYLLNGWKPDDAE